MKIAIDPGGNGAIAVKMNDGRMKHYNTPDKFADCVALLLSLASREVLQRSQVVLEDLNVKGLPLDRAKTMLGEYFKWVYVLQSLDVHPQMVAPNAWQARFIRVYGRIPKGKENYGDRKRYIFDAMARRYPTIQPALTIRNADAVAILDVMTCSPLDL